MKRLAVLALLATSLLLAVPSSAQVNDTYVIPATANVAGAFNTRWMTRISIFNPQLDYPLTVRIVYILTHGVGSYEKKLEIPANSVAWSDNLLDDLYGMSGSGALLIASFPEDNPRVPNSILARSFLVTSETYNNSAAGTFGQTIPGIWTGLQDYKWDGISAVAHGVRNIDRLGWRTNVGAVNLGRGSVTLRMNVYDADGRTIRSNIPFDVPPYGHVQDRLPVEVDGGSVEFFLDDASRTAVVFPYTSTIDQYSGDPTYQSPTLLASPTELFAKGSAAEAAALNPGRKIDLTIAREVSAAATDLGTANVTRSARGFRIGAAKQ